jgi:hypothetical protein
MKKEWFENLSGKDLRHILATAKNEIVADLLESCKRNILAQEQARGIGCADCKAIAYKLGIYKRGEGGR